MAALLIHGNKNLGCTDKPCAWKSTKTKTKDRETVTVSEMFPSSRPDYKAINRAVTEEDREWFCRELKKTGEPVGFTWLLSPEPTPDKLCIPTFDDIILSQEYLDTVNKTGYILAKLEINENTRNYVACVTTGQRTNPLWLMYRKGRVTASNFGYILPAIARESYPPSLFKRLLGEYDLSGVKSVQFGIEHEATAVQQYEQFSEKSVQQTGLWLHNSGVLGASPDGLVDDDRIVEVKCLFKYRASSIQDAIAKEKNFIISKTTTGQYLVNVNHPFYHQIQGQLYLTGRTVCDLILWTPVDFSVVSIERSIAWKCNIEKLMDFYVSKLLPKIIDGGF